MGGKRTQARVEKAVLVSRSAGGASSEEAPLVGSADRLNGFITGLFATAAMFRADATMLVLASVLLALLRT